MAVDAADGDATALIRLEARADGGVCKEPEHLERGGGGGGVAATGVGERGELSVEEGDDQRRRTRSSVGGLGGKFIGTNEGTTVPRSDGRNEQAEVVR